MTSKMRRYSVSVASNLAEGSGRSSMKEKAKFSEIAFSSALELLNQVIVSSDLEYIEEKNRLKLERK
jgi:four helix bundle protein